MIIISRKNKNLTQRAYAALLDYSIIFSCTILYIFLVGEGDEFGTYRISGFKALLVPMVWFIISPFVKAPLGKRWAKKHFICM